MNRRERLRATCLYDISGHIVFNAVKEAGQSLRRMIFFVKEDFFVRSATALPCVTTVARFFVFTTISS